MEIFEYDDYKKFLVDRIEADRASPGYKTQLAKAAGCQISFISHVLHRHAHLTPDQAYGIARFWDFQELETQYFLELIQLARAASPSLKTFIHKQLNAIKNRQLTGKAFEFQEKEKAAIYSSHWSYSAIHILLENPGYSSAKSIARYLNIPERQVASSLKTLQALGLVEKTAADKWRQTRSEIHFSQDSNFVRSFHLNWRNQAIESLARDQSGDIHFTALHAVDRATFEAINKTLVKALLSSKKAVKQSKSPEDLVCFTMDLFRCGE